ncbi:MAG: FimV/HubP family polar landmark protein [Methylobacter sp.]
MKKGKVRNLTKTLAVVSLLAPVSGHTLGIGEIKLRSALNQNLDAEIALTLSGESVSDIKVNLAPVEKFDQAGVAWNYFLSKIKFETITQSNGTTVIKLTSKEALKEPFLDFLLEVSWPKGNLYREFTVLVDPPSVYNQATAPVSTGTESYVQPTAATPQHQSNANGQGSEDEYGPTLGNDTLWSVAERARGQSDVSIEQMMIAIYEANPHAFYKGNVHALMSGKMLKIPEREAVVKLSRNQALAEFNRHTQAWKNHSAPVLDTAREKPVLNGAEKPVDNQLTLLAPTKAAVADRAVVASVNEQTSVKKKAANTSEVVTGKTEAGGSEAVPTDSAIQSKIAELEKQLAMMQELIALKDQQLAALQNQPRTNPVVQEQVAPEEAISVKPAAQVAPTPQPTEAMPGEAVTAKPAAQVAPASQPVEPMPNEVMAAKPANQSSPVPQQAAAQPPVQPIKPAAQPESEAGSLFDPYYLGVGGVGSVIFALIGWLWWRKRKVEEETNTESMFASSIMIKMPEADESLSVPLVEDSTAHDVGTIGESSFLSEFTPSDFDSFDTDQGEIDPISEADVYLAYGRYQQAEELIRQAIKDQPNRDECKLKLLEIFYANESKAAFEAYANELVAAGKRNEVDFWEKASEMGREICPDSPLFSFGDDLFAVADNTYVESNDEVKESDEAEQGVIASSAVAEKTFTDPSILLEMPSETPLSAKSQEFESYEFNISSNNTDTKETGNIDFSADKTLDFNDDFGSDFDFDFDLDLPLTTSGQYDEFGVSDLTDMDELETKLDLAKAYIDMGDADAAKDIAKEVLEQGTIEQKKTAQALLDELN